MNVIRQILDKIYIVRDEAEKARVLSELASADIQKPIRVAFANAHAVNLACTDESFLADLLACDYVFRDGAGMKILCQLCGIDPGLNMNGTDFIPEILNLYKGRSVALLGTDSPYLEAASARIAEKGLEPVLVQNGFHEAQIYVDALKDRPVPLVLLGMGMPKQEYVARMIAAMRPASLIVCGGAILDFIGGKVSRAPEYLRRAGMEWLYRLALEPRRLFKRYVVGNIVFLYRAVKTARDSQPPGGAKRVLHVVRQYAPAIGGLESYVQSMVRHQRALGYECEVLTLNKVFHGYEGALAAQETIDGVKITRVPFFGRRRFFIPLVSPLFFRRFDIVHVHNTDIFFDYLALVALITRRPFFATTHGGFFHTKDFSLIKTLYFQTITRFSSLMYRALFAISQNDFDTFKGFNKNLILQPNAVEPLGEDLSQGAGFLYIGRLAQHKNVPAVIEVFSYLKKNHQIPGKLHIVGPAWDVSLEELRHAAQKHDVADDVILHGAKTPEEMGEIAKECGYFVSASSFEGFGMSMLEAMSAGLIPFVHRNESFSELVAQSGVGQVLDYHNPAEAARIIAAALPGMTVEHRRKAQEFSTRYSWPALVRNTESAYEAFGRP
jgi:alpha-1,3-mannosyltransferase